MFKRTILMMLGLALFTMGCNDSQSPTVPHAALAVTGTMDVSALSVGWQFDTGYKRKGRAIVTIRDSAGAPVVGATVRGVWSGCSSGSVSGVTVADNPATPGDEAGTATLLSKSVACGSGNKPCSWTFAVNNVTHSNLTWDPALFSAPTSGNSGCCAPLGPPCN